MNNYKRTKRRVWKKHIKRFNKTVQAGKPVSYTLYFLINRHITQSVERALETEFRPWWWEQEWQEYSYTDCLKNFMQEIQNDFENQGLNVIAWRELKRSLTKPMEE